MARSQPAAGAWGQRMMGEAECRTIVLAQDGRWVSMGRSTRPTAAEIDKATQALAEQGVTAWLATMIGNPYAAERPRIVETRRLTGEGGDFAAAVAAWLAQ